MTGTEPPATRTGDWARAAAGAELFPGATVRLFPKVTHVALANRPEVYDAINAWWPAGSPR